MGNDPRLSGEPFTIEKDTVSGRQWRVADGWLQCEAMGGWKPVFAVTDSTDLATRLAWLQGAKISPTGLAHQYGPDRRRHDLAAIKPPVPKWGKRGSPEYRRLPPGSRPAHGTDLLYAGAQPELVAA